MRRRLRPVHSGSSLWVFEGFLALGCYFLYAAVRPFLYSELRSSIGSVSYPTLKPTSPITATTSCKTTRVSHYCKAYSRLRVMSTLHCIGLVSLRQLSWTKPPSLSLLARDVTPPSMTRMVVSDPEPPPQCQSLPLPTRQSPGAKRVRDMSGWEKESDN